MIGGGVAAAVLVLGGDDSEPSTASPLDTAESFEQAWNLTDTRTLKNLMTDDLRPFAHFDEYDMEQIDLENPEVVEESGTVRRVVRTADREPIATGRGDSRQSCRSLVPAPGREM